MHTINIVADDEQAAQIGICLIKIGVDFTDEYFPGPVKVATGDEQKQVKTLQDYQGLCQSDLCPWNYRGQCGLPALCPGRNKRVLMEKHRTSGHPPIISSALCSCGGVGCAVCNPTGKIEGREGRKGFCFKCNKVFIPAAQPTASTRLANCPHCGEVVSLYRDGEIPEPTGNVEPELKVDIPSGYRNMQCGYCGRLWVGLCHDESNFLECPGCHRMVNVNTKPLGGT